MEQAEKIEIDEGIKSALRKLVREAGTISVVSEELTRDDTPLTVFQIKNILRAGQNNNRFMPVYIAQNILRKASKTSPEDPVEFLRKMARWYSYFTGGSLESLANQLAEHLGYNSEGTNDYLTRRGKRTKKPVLSYLLDLYFEEGFRNREEVVEFINEMERLSREFPSFERVDKETIERLVTEISRISGVSPDSLLPHKYSIKKTFPFSDYQRLVRLHEEAEKRGLVCQLVSMLEKRGQEMVLPYEEFKFDYTHMAHIADVALTLKDEFKFDYKKVVGNVVQEIKRYGSHLGSHESRKIFCESLLGGLNNYLDILRGNKEHGWEVKFDPLAIRGRVVEAAQEARGYQRHYRYELRARA